MIQKCFDINVNALKQTITESIVSIARKCLKSAHSTLSTVIYLL